MRRRVRAVLNGAARFILDTELTMPTYITTRNMTYNTRRLKAGDEFTAQERDGKLLVKLGRAELKPSALVTPAKPKFVPPPPPVIPPAPPVVVTPESEASAPETETPPVDTLAVARADYEAALGKRAFHGWDETELRRRIAEHADGS